MGTNGPKPNENGPSPQHRVKWTWKLKSTAICSDKIGALRDPNAFFCCLAELRSTKQAEISAALRRRLAMKTARNLQFAAVLFWFALNGRHPGNRARSHQQNNSDSLGLTRTAPRPPIKFSLYLCSSDAILAYRYGQFNQRTSKLNLFFALVHASFGVLLAFHNKSTKNGPKKESAAQRMLL